MSPQDCKQKHTATDFVKWQRFFELEANEHQPLHYYLARVNQLLETMINGWAGEKRRVTLEENLLKFDFKGPDKSLKARKKYRRQKTDLAKAAVFTMLGIDKDGNPANPNLKKIKKQLPPQVRERTRAYTPPGNPVR